MQIKFYFYTIYASAMEVGFKPDDAKYKHVLDFENGGRFYS